MSRAPLRLATRGSALARVQAEMVAALLAARGIATEILPMTTTGDRIAGPLPATGGGKGLFLKELEEALLAGTADIAVHSLKDVPAALPEGLALAAYLPREDPRDAVVTRDGAGLAAVAAAQGGALAGTASERRRLQIAPSMPSLRWSAMRGNVDSRLRRLDAGEVDALLLAAAGLRRLGLASRIAELLPVERMVPSAGQGIVCVEALADGPAAELLAGLDDAEARLAATIERACVAELGADCNLPVGIHAARQPAGRWLVLGFVGDPAGRASIRRQIECVAEHADAAMQLGGRLAEELLAAGARGLLASSDKVD